MGLAVLLVEDYERFETLATTVDGIPTILRLIHGDRDAPEATALMPQSELAWTRLQTDHFARETLSDWLTEKGD